MQYKVIHGQGMAKFAHHPLLLEHCKVSPVRSVEPYSSGTELTHVGR